MQYCFKVTHSKEFTPKLSWKIIINIEHYDLWTNQWSLIFHKISFFIILFRFVFGLYPVIIVLSFSECSFVDVFVFKVKEALTRVCWRLKTATLFNRCVRNVQTGPIKSTHNRCVNTETNHYIGEISLKTRSWSFK